MATNKIKLKCQICKKEFEVWPYGRNRKYCSRKCANNAMIGNHRRPITRVKKICPLCGKIFEVKKSHANIRKFCSQKCYDKFRMRETVIRTCPICGKKFKVVAARKSSARYCSYICYYKAHKGTNFHELISKIKRKCACCGTEFEMFPCKVKQEKGKYCSKECYTKDAVGKNSWSWRDGSSFEPYPPEFNNNLKEETRKRDNYICQKCGKTQEEELLSSNRKLAIHHIDYDKTNCNPNNLITLCVSCNAKVNINREYWQQYFQKLIYEHSQSQLQFV